MSARNATTIVKLFISSRAQVLVMEAPVRFGTTEAWTTVLQPQMHMAGCEMETATLKATAVGIPTNKRRLFVAAVKRHGDDSLKSKLTKWKQNVERPAPSIPSVGTYLGRQGSFFLRRGRDVKEIFSLTEPTVTITQEQIRDREPSAEAFNRGHGKKSKSCPGSTT